MSAATSDPASARPGRGALAALNAFATGAMLGVYQWSAFFLLQSYLASTAIVYLLATGVWLIGSLVGMLLPGRREVPYLLGAAACFQLFRIAASRHPYALAWLPPLLLLVAGMGAYAGRFFRCRADGFAAVKWLFFWENTGFVGGMMVTAFSLYWAGEAFFGLASLVAPALALATAAPFLVPGSGRARPADVEPTPDAT